MAGCSRARRTLRCAAFALLVGVAPCPAFADLTVFGGRVATVSGASDASAARPAWGAALGLSPHPFGIEFEFGSVPARSGAGQAAWQPGMFALLVGGPAGGGIQVYGAAGGGWHRERFGEQVRTDLAASGGGGVLVRIAEPFHLRLDARVFAFRGDARPAGRIYAGLHVAF